MNNANNSRRRRSLGMVTANACTECRKKRTKCDGQTPCSRCSSQKDIVCVYKVPIWQSKEYMRSQIEELRAYQQQSKRVLGALISDDHSSHVIGRLRNGESLKNISDDLKKPSHAPKKDITLYPTLSDGQTIDAVMVPMYAIPTSQFTNLRLEEAQGSISVVQQAKDQTLLSSLLGLNNITNFIAGTKDDLINWAPDTNTVPNTLSQYPAIGHWHEQMTDHSTLDSTVLYARDKGQAAMFGHESGGDHSDQKSFDPLSWTNVTSDRQLIDHLIALYFCWEYPTFASLSKEHFLKAYKTGDLNYCSDLLVNAIQAVGCQFSSQAGARADPNDSNTAGDHFFAKTERLLFEEKDHRSLTTI
ncbi:hypothetical protein BTUL_0245g00060 [Botrytis tulipae]|uniref:Zn(2)-C6 fungal-type domain-containing protein n=1 Tax=Botrytis tulipae TaxID=87230 RepID=A0A4Z1EB58_9HELO|nr:hypothetical protein BTUL_0245g00060 [Botrytis tulipae]